MITTDFDSLPACPKCDTRWQGTDIYEYFIDQRNRGESHYKDKTDEEIRQVAYHYGWYESLSNYLAACPWMREIAAKNPDRFPEERRSKFSHLVGIELPLGHPQHYDGISMYQCPGCKTLWDRFTGGEVKYEEHGNIVSDECPPCRVRLRPD